MQLKHKGKQVQITLTKPERKLLEKAGELLAGIAMLPCDMKDSANDAVAAIEVIVMEFGKEEAQPRLFDGEE